ncbi:transposase [Streptosporangium algeriense]|uniref:Transposase n=1 Tax=Streptosporangium algeriense TaxID=1682748 RepID=A0ABW3DIA5_9ACTN
MAAQQPIRQRYRLARQVQRDGARPAALAQDLRLKRPAGVMEHQITGRQQLGGSIVLVWDNPNPRISHAMRSHIAARDWLTVYRLPAYAPELNPVEGVWASMKHGLDNLLVGGPDALNATIKPRLKHIRYRPDLIDGFFAETGLSLEPT